MKTDPTEDICLDRPIKEVWNKVLELLAKQMREPTYKTWVVHTQLTALHASEATLAVANDFARNHIVKHAKQIESAVNQVIGREITLKVVVDGSSIDTDSDYSPSIASITVVPEKRLKQDKARPADAQIPEQISKSSLNPKYDFDTFVVGSSNRFCHAAALAVADKPGQAYNPLFLYGGVGLGKTHLLHAIGKALLQRSPQKIIRYMSCEKFTNEVINSIRDDKMVDFRKRYRQIDLLLMDDIQFIEGKESTQEEFFHTFNHLRDNGKQIVLTSDRPPKDLAKLAERLRSRFEWGLIADIQAPDYEMRLAILRKKAEQEKMSVADEVLDYIANAFTNNIRELEGALLRAHAYSALTGSSIDLSTVSQILHSGAQKKDRPVLTVEKIIEIVANHYGIEPADIRSSKRSQDLTIPRHIAMYLAHELMSLSFPRVGQAFGNRKHTSALYACDKVKEAISQDPVIAETVRKISRQLGV